MALGLRLGLGYVVESGALCLGCVIKVQVTARVAYLVRIRVRVRVLTLTTLTLTLTEP